MLTAPTFATIDPARGSELERFPRMSAEHIDAALEDVRRTFVARRTLLPSDRSDDLRRLAKLIRRDAETLARTASREMGKPIVQARAEVEKCAKCCDYFAEHGPALLAERAVETDATESYVAFRPLGVLFAIMPWNFPYWQVIRAAAPAIAAGNTVVLKHSDNTTRCALEIERLVLEAAPEPLMRALLIDTQTTDDLIADERIAAVTLTGSERAGTAVAEAAGRVLKKCVLELGGSDPFIVLRDADLNITVEFAVKARFQNTGQSCIAAKRFIVHSSLYDEFTERFAYEVARQRVGDPLDESTQVGPCARGDLRDGLQRQVDETLRAGGRLVTGGKALHDAPGFFYAPTVVADVPRTSPMWTEETFGPAAAVVSVESDEEAIALANDTAFGLGASIWSRDERGAQTFASRIEAGAVFVNGIVASDPRLPFGGVKRSGYGRELSAFGIHEFCNVQTIWVGPDRHAAPAAE